MDDAMHMQQAAEAAGLAGAMFRNVSRAPDCALRKWAVEQVIATGKWSNSDAIIYHAAKLIIYVDTGTIPPEQ